MAISEANADLPGVLFNTGVDVTADDLTAVQQYLAQETLARSGDFIKYAGFAWGIRVGAVVGQSVQITAGVGFDRNGIRLAHPQTATYDIVFPQTGIVSGYLYVVGEAQNISYRVNPNTGERKASESAIALGFAVESTVLDDTLGHIYPSEGSGLVIAKLTVSADSYSYDDVVTSSNTSIVRSPNLVLQDGN